VALERRRPLPAGRYWLDVFPRNAVAWATWSSAMSKMGAAKVEVTEHYDSVDGAPEHDFVIFSTTSPNAAYYAAGLPYPTIAATTVTTSDDTATKPPPEPGVLEQLSSAAAGVGASAKVGLGVGVAVVVVVGAVALLRR